MDGYIQALDDIEAYINGMEEIFKSVDIQSKISAIKNEINRLRNEVIAYYESEAK